MAQVSFTEFSNFQKTQQAQGTRVGYFSLKNDGDEAVVRIMHDSVDSLDIAIVHRVNLGGKYRNVNCIRKPTEPLGKCPLCEANEPIATRVFVHLIEYVRDENGNVVPTPKIWERPSSYAGTLQGLLSEYGPLSQHLFKIKRHGDAGSKQTTYDTNYCVPNNYPSNVFVPMNNAFDGFSILKFHVMDKSAEEMNEFLKTGSFPSNNSQEGTQKVEKYAATDAPASIPSFKESNHNTAFGSGLQGGASMSQPQQQRNPWDVPMNGQPEAQRPVRYFQ